MQRRCFSSIRKQLTLIRKSADFIDKTKYGADVMMTGAIGTICGVQVVVSNQVRILTAPFLIS